MKLTLRHITGGEIEITHPGNEAYATGPLTITGDEEIAELFLGTAEYLVGTNGHGVDLTGDVSPIDLVIISQKLPTFEVVGDVPTFNLPKLPEGSQS